MKFKSILFSVSLFLLGVNVLLSQTEEQLKEVRRKTDTISLKLMGEKYHLEFTEGRVRAMEWAKKHGYPTKGKTKNGGTWQLDIIDKNSKPVHKKTNDIDQAKTISTNKVWTGALYGGDIQGTGITVGEWDGGSIKKDHVEFDTRVVIKDDIQDTMAHATHVGGIIMAKGTAAQPNAKGMAPKANLWYYNWDNAFTEMNSFAATLKLISNHSYGLTNGWICDTFDINTGECIDWYWWGIEAVSTKEDYYFGLYTADFDAKFDKIAYDAPYYSIVVAAGNDRNEGPTPGTAHYYLVEDTTSGYYIWSDNKVTTIRDKDGGTNGYDCIGPYAVAKNVITVGAVQKISNSNDNNYSSTFDVKPTTFSSWGPTDDGRIKPDIVAAGLDIYSTSISINPDDSSIIDHYEKKNGTSMAAPSVSGSLALLQQYFFNKKGKWMRSSTAKALVIHTADEAGPADGPDYMYGWGLMNTSKAADLISGAAILENSKSTISETNLLNGEAKRVTFTYGSGPIKITIAWTDLPGTPLDPNDLPDPKQILNNRTRMLVNDLDMYLVPDASPTTKYYPYTLNPTIPSSNANKGNDSINNVEQIYISAPLSGGYSLFITHKRILALNRYNERKQDFAIIFSGAKDIVVGPEDPVKISGPSLISSINPATYSATYNYMCGIPSFSFKLHYRDGLYTIPMSNIYGCYNSDDFCSNTVTPFTLPDLEWLRDSVGNIHARAEVYRPENSLHF